MFVDSHIHMSRKQYNGKTPCIDSQLENERIVYLSREELINKMKAKDIVFCIEPAVELESNAQLLELAADYPGFVYPAVGVHPTRSFLTKWKDRKVVEQLSLDKRVIAIGELGLDYHYERKKQHRFKQLMWFLWQLKLAHKRNLPLILHIREADEDAIKVLRYSKKKIKGGVCHCFNRGMYYAKVYTEEFGFMLGIGGSLLQSDSQELEETVKQIPLEFLVLETDGPYVKPMKPEGISGKQWGKSRNTSLIIPDVAERIAELKGIDVQEVEKVTTENVKRLFNINC